MKTKISCSFPEIDIKYFDGFHPKLEIKKLESINGHFNMLKEAHRSSFLQLLIISNGTGLIDVDSRQYNIYPKSLFASAGSSISKFQLEKDTSGYAVFFTPEFLYRYPEDLHWINDLLLFDPLSELNLLPISDTEYSEISALINNIETELHSIEVFAREEILFNTLKTLIILSERIKRTKITSPQKESGNSLFINEFRNKLEENYIHTRMVKDYADSMNITPRKLNNILFDSYGKSAKQFIEERVLLEIKRLIIHSEKNIKEIGHSLGFTDPTNFNKFFKRYTKLTPADFRSLYK